MDGSSKNLAAVFTKGMLLLFFLAFAMSLRAQETSFPVDNGPAMILGIASYYHPAFHGRTMANGEDYSMHELTAASNKIPLNKWAKVTNLSNNKSVMVKITDHMAKFNKRVIDLSFGAAKELEMIEKGIMKVKIEIQDDYDPEQ